MSAILTERLVSIAQAARKAGHGKKEAIYQAACEELNLSRATLLRRIKEVVMTEPRKRRNDSGKSALTRDEALLISAVLKESTRKNGKRLYSIKDAVNELRANNMIRAESIDETTGEIKLLSESAIIRALRAYKVHPDQLDKPAPHSRLASLHPNHVWQIDASLCVLYYLKNGAKTSGLRVMHHDTFYKNKPKNLAKIANERVWSYEITDHTSGWIYVEYVLGAESGENLCSVLINAMQERGNADVLHGVPQILYMDPGSANTASTTKNLCRSLGINAISHAPGSARATGSVEKARDIIERKFEPGLVYQPVNSLEELNVLAKKWRSVFNATEKHSRHGDTRTNIWLKITPEQLVKAPSVEICKELAIATPVSRVVEATLEIKFKGHKYSVADVPGIMVGDSILVTQTPWREDAAQIVLHDENGHEYFHLAERVEFNEFGFAEDAAIIGQSYKKTITTEAQKTQAEIEQLVTGTTSSTDATAVRKVKSIPFGGEFNPYKSLEDAALPSYLPKQGQESEVRSPRIEQRPLTHVEAAKLLREKLLAMNFTWTAQHYQQLTKLYPDGVPEDAIETLIQTLTTVSASNVVNLR